MLTESVMMAEKNNRVGIIGVGHLAGYLVEGLKRASPGLDILLSQYLGEQTARLVSQFGALPAEDNQAVADGADLVLVTTRPGDIVGACEAVSFHTNHTVVSTAAGISLEELRPAVSPATVVRVMPITCAVIHRSPTLLHPENSRARALFELLGSVHVLADEAEFTPASVIAAYYGWVYALLDETVAWTTAAGVPAQTARALVLETTRGAAEMGLAYPDRALSALLDSLATPGGITRYGLKILEERRSLAAWTEALDGVLDRLRRS
jgi:pyrroline-5-carboxylate reductase